MKNKIKVWFHDSSSSNIKEFSVSKFFLVSLVIFFLTFAAGLTYTGFDYYKLKETCFGNKILLEKIKEQNNEIQTQRVQIQNFAHEINSIKAKVINLAEFESRVRVIADIKPNSESSLLFGTGGFSHEELDSKLQITQKHNSLIREMHKQVNQIETASLAKTSDFKQLLKQLAKKRNILASTPSIRPVKGWITSKFGYRKSPFTGQKEFHSGIDIANRKGTKIIATAKGKVSYAKKKMFMGKMVVIDHGHGLVTKFGHLSKILVKRGDIIKRGDVLGLMGNTGRSTGPHVHYEIKINGVSVNPQKYILN